jgi:hypothetical protein
LRTVIRGVPRILPGGMHIFSWPTPSPPPINFLTWRYIWAHDAWGGCTCILCIPPGYAPDRNIKHPSLSERNLSKSFIVSSNQARIIFMLWER